MRLTKVKLAGFKSFVDPTTVQFPANLTGVVGPNGCGKSNVIDAVRWVMGELSARHLRGDSMTDVIFNGSGSRKPVGAASVELVFDNSDGKIGGAYASYNEIALKRLVSRDGSSVYFINGARCRRKDITQLFLGTGLGSRSYAIIEQGMISRVIEARTEEMRSFVEEAAGISRYKERRRETESRVAETRENLERLQDLRDEVEKQIRHLQRQASAARRYQEMKNDERRLSAELLALRLREIDSGAAINDRAVRDRDLVLQQELAEQRAAEAALDKQREYQVTQADRLREVQGRSYTLGAEIARTEQTLQHTRELRERRRVELAQTTSMLGEVGAQVTRDEEEQQRLRGEIAQFEPQAASLGSEEQRRAAALEEAEQALHAWQERWEEFNRALGGTHQTTQVERARMEQLEDQLRRFGQHADRIAVELENLVASDPSATLSGLADREADARRDNESLAEALRGQLARVQSLRGEQGEAEAGLERARNERDRTQAEKVSLEALQKAALGAADRDAGAWLQKAGLAGRARAAEQISVDAGWERAVEVVIGDYLDAVCVDGLDALDDSLASLGAGQVTFVEQGTAGEPPADSLAAHVEGPAAVLRRLAGVLTAPDLRSALQQRHSLEGNESIVTRAGEWVGRDWLRISRGGDTHAGVIEREQRLKVLRTLSTELEGRVRNAEQRVASLREAVEQAERERDATQARIAAAHRAHADALGQLEGLRARSEETKLRRERLQSEGAQVDTDSTRARDALARARDEFARASAELERLDAERLTLETEREERRAASADARTRAQEAQRAARDVLIQLEGRRSAQNSIGVALQRLGDQRAQLQTRHGELEEELRGGDGPVDELATLLDELLARRLDMDAELGAARDAMQVADADLEALEQKRQGALQRVTTAREQMEEARLAAQESRVRREGIAEQFSATGFDLAETTSALAADANTLTWEDQLVAVRQSIEKLGQVNLAAIDELREQGERQTYLDRQYNDLRDALDTLDEAMRKIEKETRSRFEDTFNRINDGLKEKFPRLFGGGHAYLELVGDDVLSAGVAVMARPPGKRNVTISQLSGGEKALTAVALVFSIFDLNPAPFCLLDEVDAPLDEHNVGRFCDIVREMSSRVQFIFITHNKATMELASQLIGVTMHEAGVSRLVAVDVDEAVRLAAV